MSSHRGEIRLRRFDLVLLLTALAVMLAGTVVVGYRGAASGVTGAARVLPPARSTASDGTVESAAGRLLRSVVSLSAVGRSQRVDGAGIVIRSDGTILTAAHLVADVAEHGGQITVARADGTTSPAVVVGQVPQDDVAVVRATRWHDLQPATLTSSRGLRVGQQVIVVGNPLGEPETVTAGIVSSLDRTECADGGTTNGSIQPSTGATGTPLTLHGLIQTDAHINPGTSGGALADLHGDVVGVVVMSRTPTGEGEGSVGIGFAIPIDAAYADAQRLLSRATR